MDFADRATILPSDKPLSQTDELFCLWRRLCPMTKSNAEWRVGVQPVLLIANNLWTPPMGYVEWRSSIVMFKQLSTIGHWTTQKGVVGRYSPSGMRSRANLWRLWGTTLAPAPSKLCGYGRLWRGGGWIWSGKALLAQMRGDSDA